MTHYQPQGPGYDPHNIANSPLNNPLSTTKNPLESIVKSSVDNNPNQSSRLNRLKKAFSGTLVGLTLLGMAAGVSCGEPVVDNPPKMMGYNIIVEDTIAGCVVSGEQFNLEVGVDDDYGVKSVRIDIPSAGIEKNLKEIDGSWYLDNTIKLPEKGNYDLKITATDTSDQTSILEGSIFCGEPHDLCDCYCQQATPGGEVGYEFGGSDFTKYKVIFNLTDTLDLYDVGISTELLKFQFDNKGKGYIGPQIEFNSSSNTTEKKVIFSIESMNDEEYTAHPYPTDCPECYVDDAIEGKLVRWMIDYDWIEGKNYKITVQKDEVVDGGVVWNATIEDLLEPEAEPLLIGKIKLDDQEGHDGYGLLDGYAWGSFEYDSGNKQCLDAEHVKIIRIGPVGENESGLWLPREATYENTECIRAIRYLPEYFPLGVIVEEVGAGVERDPEDLLTDTLWDHEFDWRLSDVPQLEELFN